MLAVAAKPAREAHRARRHRAHRRRRASRRSRRPCGTICGAELGVDHAPEARTTGASTGAGSWPRSVANGTSGAGGAGASCAAERRERLLERARRGLELVERGALAGAVAAHRGQQRRAWRARSCSGLGATRVRRAARAPRRGAARRAAASARAASSACRSARKRASSSRSWASSCRSACDAVEQLAQALRAKKSCAGPSSPAL